MDPPLSPPLPCRHSRFTGTAGHDAMSVRSSCIDASRPWSSVSRGSLAPDVEVEAALYGVSLGIADGWRENGSMQIITGLLPVILPTTRDGNGYPKPDGFLLY